MLTGPLEEIFVPQELDLVRTLRICEPLDRSKHTPLVRIESTGRHIDVLGLDLELPTASARGPYRRGMKECGPNSLPSNIRRDPNVPQGGEILTAFQHGDAGAV